jgi:hypothetical protein
MAVDKPSATCSEPPGKPVAATSAADALAGLARETARISAIASEALRVSESRYRRSFETTQDGIPLINADTVQIEDVNPYLGEMIFACLSAFCIARRHSLCRRCSFAFSLELFWTGP